jgi:hypothetical protein
MGGYHKNDDETTIGGIIFGIILTIGVVTVINHGIESTCQNENDVADCEWVSVPAEQEGTKQSVIYQK